jgi:hypothetical protein
MAIATGTAILGAAILGGGAALAGASKQSQAAKKAAAAQGQASDQSLALQREIYYDQRGLQQPYYQAGLQGLYGESGVMDLLGKGGGGGGQPNALAPQQQTGGQPNYASGTYGQAPIGQAAPQSGNNWRGYLDANPDVMNAYASTVKQPHFTKGAGKAADTNRDGTISPTEFGAHHYEHYGRGEGRQLPQYQPQANALAQTTGQVGPAVQVGQDGASQQGPSGTPALETGPTEGPMTQALRQTPGYQFMQDEGKRAVENSFASRGKLLSGSAMTALQDRSMGVADQTYQQSVNNNFNLAALGSGASVNMQNAGNSYANGASNALMNSGNAQANGYMNQANAWNQGAQGVGNALMGGVGMYGGYKGWGGGTPATYTQGTFNPMYGV